MSSWFRANGFQEVYKGLLVGAVPLDDDDVATLEWLGVSRVLNLVEDAEYDVGARGHVERAYRDAGISERRISVVDFGHLPPEALERAVKQVSDWLDDGQLTYLHCRAGRQRSASVAAGVIATRDGLDVDQAVAHVQLRRPLADPLPHQREDLRRWWKLHNWAEQERRSRG